MSKTNTIDHVTRIEGHTKITIQLNDDGKVTDTKYHVTQVRGFEKFVEGRPYYELPSITARICGICPTSHLIASVKACDAIMAVQIPEPARLLRELARIGEGRNRAAQVRPAGDRAAGERIHPSWTVPGGVNKPLSKERRDFIHSEIPIAKSVIRRTLKFFFTPDSSTSMAISTSMTEGCCSRMRQEVPSHPSRLEDAEILAPHVRATAGVNALDGVGIAEAPRGTLIHHYKVDEQGAIVWANLITATGHNNLAINRSIKQVAEHFVDGDQLKEGIGGRARVRSLLELLHACDQSTRPALGSGLTAIPLAHARGSETLRDYRTARLTPEFVPSRRTFDVQHTRFGGDAATAGCTMRPSRRACQVPSARSVRRIRTWLVPSTAKETGSAVCAPPI